jgi:integrase
VKNLIVMLLLFACGAAVGWLLRDNRDGRKQPDAYPVEISVHHFQHPDRTAEVMDVVSVEDASIVNRVGKRIRKTVYGSTKGDVQTKLDELRTEARAGNLPEASSLTVDQLLERWLTSDEQKSATRTHEERERLVKNHLKPRLGGVKLAKLNALHIEGLYADMARDKVGPFAIRSAADVLSIALNDAVRLKLIRSNPAAAVKKPKTPKREMLCLNEVAAKAVLNAAVGAPVGTLVTVALGTGCRQGELLALMWEDIDLKAGTLTIRRSLAQTKKGFVTKEPKTAASRRTLTLPAFVVESLTALKAVRMKAGLLDKPVFCTRTGGYLCKKNVLRAFRGVVKKANTAIQAATKKAADEKASDEVTANESDLVKLLPEKVRFHDLRHTVASLLLSKGHSLKAVSQRLGHANPTMTLRVYAHTMPNDDAKLAEGLARMMA